MINKCVTRCINENTNNKCVIPKLCELPLKCKGIHKCDCIDICEITNFQHSVNIGDVTFFWSNTVIGTGPKIIKIYNINNIIVKTIQISENVTQHFESGLSNGTFTATIEAINTSFKLCKTGPFTLGLFI